MVPLDSPVNIVFSEWVDHNSFESSYSISPSVGEIALKWHGKRVELKHNEPFNESTTYVLNLGTILKDLHNNPLPAARTFCFSTGTIIDSGYIQGKVFIEKHIAPNKEVWAFKLDEQGEFNLGEQPDYVTWSGQDGSFEFSFLPIDSFRIMAVDDMNGDGLINVGIENVGIPPYDVNSGSPPPLLNIMLGFQDTVKTELLHAESPDNQKVALKFSRTIDITSLEKTDIRFIDMPGGILYSKPYFTDDEFRIIEFAFQQPISPEEHRISISNVLDLYGNPVETDTIVFTTSSNNDTILPKIKEMIPANNSRHVMLNHNIRIVLTEAIRNGTFTLNDSLGNKVEGTIKQDTPNEIIYIPEYQLEEAMYYSWRIQDFTDYAGNQLKDTTFHKFKTLDSDTFGTLIGKIMSKFYPLDIEVINVQTKQSYDYELIDSVLSMESFPGQYNLFLYYDRDENGRLSVGKWQPFEHSELFWVISDTIYIRSRWETEIYFNLGEE
ncbi:Ig-like domain-containing protein [bacterium]|nr:Ig-like domain-containing protein [bacterium]